MPTSRVKKFLFLTFEIAAKWQNVGYIRRSHRLISLNQLMSPNKTEFMLLGSRRQMSKSGVESLMVVNDRVLRSDLVKYLRVWLDQYLTFEHHVKVKSKTAICNIVKLMHIRRFMAQKTMEIFVFSLVISHLDYANGILLGSFNYVLNKFQLVQKWAAKLVLNRKKFDSSSKALKQLLWLPIEYRIQFKIIALVKKCLQGDAPDYLKDLLCES